MPDPTRLLAARFKALSEPVRLEILALLLHHGELCVCDLEACLGVTQSACSRHLRYLANAGLVESERVGVWVHYRVPADADPATLSMLDLVRARLDPDRVATLLGKLGRRLAEKGDVPLCGRREPDPPDPTEPNP